MPLEAYRDKRKLNKTPEPAGGAPAGSTLQFVVQKHAASHLHYDFRLELRGVLKSWAVPKGPSMNAEDRRLAMLVEDHPFDYKDFEGIIPEGNYGAGTVIIWDSGTYEPIEPITGKKEQEHFLTTAFYEGGLAIRLHGKKLKGEFGLVKMEDKGANAWYLVKLKDRYAVKTDITTKDKSVVSGKTIAQMADDKAARTWKSNRPAATKTSKSKNKKTNGISIQVQKGIRSAMPARVRPMLCTLTKEPVNDPQYLYEIKWDGYRIISFVQKGKVIMHSRSALDYTDKYPPVVAALKKLGHDAVIDGEMVVFNEQGEPDFNAVQNYNGHKTALTYCIFDLLWLDGYSLVELPLTERKDILRQLLAENDTLRYSESFEDGQVLFEKMKEMNLEGIIAKRKDSTYNEGERANDWLKTPTRKRQEFIIGGWAESDKSRAFRSLLFGAYRDGALRWVGRSGGGYKHKEMAGILKMLKANETKKSPFVNAVLDTKGATIHWVKPKLVANFEFATWTNTGRIRKPATFLGFRKDKKPTDVVLEQVKPVDKIEEEIHEQAGEPKQPTYAKTKRYKYLNEGSNWKSVDEEQQGAVWEELEIDQHHVRIHHIERELWKGIPKANLIMYYNEIAGLILPYLKDRPQSLVLKTVSAGGPRKFIKDMENRQPEYASVYTDKRRNEKKGKRQVIDYLVCNNRQTLIYMIDLGCIDINPWASRTTAIEYPDYLWIDLDPTIADNLHGTQREKAEDEGFKKAVKVAAALKKVLDKLKLTGFIKTSGQTGLHVYVPCTGIHFDSALELARHIAKQTVALVPTIATSQTSKSLRQVKVYVDADQNNYADTLAAPYCVRGYHWPLVSAPLEWKELTSTLDRKQFTIDTMRHRLKKKGDLFASVNSDKIKAKNTAMLKKIMDKSNR